MKDPHEKREQQNYEHPIASREAILACMGDLGEPVSLKRLAKTLDIENKRDRDALRNRMRAMVRDGQLVVDRRNVFAIAGRMEVFAGRVTAHADGFGFLICDEDRDDIFLSHRQIRGVFHGDRALVRIRGRDRRGRDEGEIVEVLERNTQELVGRVIVENQVALLEALNRKIDHEILLNTGGLQPQAGQIVVGRITRQPSFHGLAEAEVVTVLGDHLTPEMEVEVALRNNDIPFEFADDLIAEVDEMPFEVKPQQKRQREDLRHLDFVTIDGEDARDFDDAVYCEKRRGGYRLFVAIADVAHYVSVGSSLDAEAHQRGTSVYFPQYVVPMLPEKLSNGLCSLNPEVDRLVMVCEMTLSNRGRIGSYQFYEGVINSKERLTYTQVGAWVEAGEFPRHKDSLGALVELSKILLASRAARGALEFDTREVAFGFSAEGRVNDVHTIKRNFAHKLIEECMLCANVSAAKFIAKNKLPGLYRVHDKPETDRIEALKQFLSVFGIDLGEGAPEDYQRAVQALRGQQNSPVLQIALLRSMQQAVYQPENRGHFGLGYSHYTHFTSPIRRYPDLLTHRLIKSVIHSQRECAEVRRFGKPKKIDYYPYDMERAVSLGEHVSFTERRADDAVYEVLEWVKCDFLSDHVGDDFQGVISAVTKFGFFVQLDEVLVEGLVHVSALAGDYYHFDVGEQCLTGERTAETFGLGDMVTVQVARVDVDERKVDLELLSHSPIRRRKRPTKKPAGRGGKPRGRSDRSGKSAGGARSESGKTTRNQDSEQTAKKGKKTKKGKKAKKTKNSKKGKTTPGSKKAPAKTRAGTKR